MANEVKIYPQLNNLFAERLRKVLKTKIDEDLSDSDTTVTVEDGSVFTEDLPFHVIFRDTTYGRADEIVKVTAINGDNLTVVRGQCGTTAYGQWYSQVYLCDRDTWLTEHLWTDETTITVSNASGLLPADADCPYYVLLRDTL